MTTQVELWLDGRAVVGTTPGPTPETLARGVGRENRAPCPFHCALTAVVLVLGGCACERPERDVDAGVDAGEEDSGPIGAWQPAFSPRLIYQRDLACPPVAYPSYDPGRVPVDPGTVRWVYVPSRDSRFVEAAARFSAVSGQFLWNRLTFVPDGGVIAVIDDLFELGLNFDGSFGWLDFGVRQRPDRAWLPPSRSVVVGSGVLRDASHPLSTTGAQTIPRLAEGAVVEDACPVRLPLYGQFSEERVIAASPALLRDGTVVWAATPNALVLACMETGEIRAVIEHDSPPWNVSSRSPGIYATRLDEFIFAWHALYRFRSSGELVAENIAGDLGVPEFGVTPMGLSDSCGLALAYQRRLEWRDPETLAVRSAIPTAGPNYHLTPTADCGVIEYLAERTPRRVRRVDAAGNVLFDVSEPIASRDAGLRDLWAVENGVLLLYASPPHATVINDDGTIATAFALDRSEYGDVVAYNNGLTPDGVLVFVTAHGLDPGMIVAVQTSVRPTYPSFRFLGQSGLDWAHTGGTWMVE